MLASHALALVGVPMRRVIRVVQDQRDARYGMLRGYFHGTDDDTADELNQERLASISLPLATRHAGKNLDDLLLHSYKVKVITLRRSTGVIFSPSDNPVLQGLDTLVISGLPESIALVEAKLSK